MALSPRVEDWIRALASETYLRWCNESLRPQGVGFASALEDGLRAAYRQGRRDQRDGFVEEGDPLEALEAQVLANDPGLVAQAGD